MFLRGGSGIDVTTIMLLGWLDMLEDAFSGLVISLIPSGTMTLLFK